ncbi:MAG: DUF3781 domain-containing protein [Treponema sp.]|nr:DUF3781 domain-containing protein [Treponema sp.]
MKNGNVLLDNIAKIHTTPMGVERIRRNLGLGEEVDDVVEWCCKHICDKQSEITRNGKNWYCKIDGYIITVNAYSYTIITAHKEKKVRNAKATK